MLQPSQNDLFRSLLNLARQKHLVQNSIDLIEIKHQIQLANVSEELIQDFDKEMNGFQVCEFVVVGVDTGAEEEAGVPAVD